MKEGNRIPFVIGAAAVVLLIALFVLGIVSSGKPAGNTASSATVTLTDAKQAAVTPTGASERKADIQAADETMVTPPGAGMDGGNGKEAAVTPTEAGESIAAGADEDKPEIKPTIELENNDADQDPEDPAGDADAAEPDDAVQYIIFGRYEQDGDTENGPEPLEWEVLEDSNGSRLLISRYIIDCRQYNTDDTAVSWESCTLRSWLNGEFFDTAFSPAEKDHILMAKVSNPVNEYYKTDNENETKDKVFCLSVEEIRKYYTFNIWHKVEQIGFYERLITDMTQYALNRGVEKHTISSNDFNWFLCHEGADSSVIGMESGGWWLRSTGRSGKWACYVDELGRCGWGSDGIAEFGRLGVRPAIYLSR